MKRTIFTIILAFVAATTFAQSDARVAFNKTLTNYYAVKNALAGDNSADAAKAATVFVAHLEKQPKQFVENEQKGVWAAQSAELKKAAGAISAEKDIKVQRKAFENLSYAMIKVVKAINLNDKQVYLQHCPMAKASWLNEVEDIQNPYYGSMMYDCGDVKEVIK